MVSLDKLAIAVVVFFVFIVGGVFIVHDLDTSYEDVDMNIDDYIEDTYETGSSQQISDSYSNPSNETFEYAENMQDKIIGGEVEDGSIEDSMFKGSFGAARLMTTMKSIINNVMNQIAKELGIPSFFITFAFIILSIAVSFALIYLIFRVKA